MAKDQRGPVVRSGLHGPEYSGRECGCPPYVVRCAHFEGRAVWLQNTNDWARACLGLTPPRAMFPNIYAVGVGDGPEVCTRPICYCTGSGVEHIQISCATEEWSEFSDLAAAEAEFSRREALLLHEVPA